MAELGVIGLMISSTATAAGVLGLIKRRCGACEGIETLTEKCADHIFSIQELLETLEEGAKPPSDVRSIITALNQSYREFKAIEKQLGKVDRRTKRASRTERFILAQGWLKKLEGIYDDLQHMRQDVKQLVVSWESRRVVVDAIQDIMTIDATRNAERHDRMAVWASDYEESDELVSANNADRIFLTGVKLSPRDWKALSRFGKMDELSLPDALFKAGEELGRLVDDLDFWCSRGYEFSERVLSYSRHSIRLLRLAAEFQHPEAHNCLGWCYWYGYGTEIDLDSSILHFKIAFDSGVENALYGLSEVYKKMGEPEMSLKYLISVAEHNMFFSKQVVLRLISDTGNVDNADEARKWLKRCHDPLFISFCYFFGIVVERNLRKAVRFAEKLNVDDAEYQVHEEKEQFVRKSFVEYEGPKCGELHNLLCTLDWPTSSSKLDMFKEWIDYMFDNGLQSMIVGQLETDTLLVTNDQFESYAVRAARDGSVVAHLALAHYSTVWFLEDQDWRRAEQHLRIAAEMGHSSAQEVCRELFGDTEKPSRSIENVEEEIELQRRALHNLSMSAERTLSR